MGLTLYEHWLVIVNLWPEVEVEEGAEEDEVEVEEDDDEVVLASVVVGATVVDVGITTTVLDVDDHVEEDKDEDVQDDEEDIEVEVLYADDVTSEDEGALHRLLSLLRGTFLCSAATAACSSSAACSWIARRSTL